MVPVLAQTQSRVAYSLSTWVKRKSSLRTMKIETIVAARPWTIHKQTIDPTTMQKLISKHMHAFNIKSAYFNILKFYSDQSRSKMAVSTLIEMIQKVCIIGSRIDVNITEEDTGVLLEYI